MQLTTLTCTSITEGPSEVDAMVLLASGPTILEVTPCLCKRTTNRLWNCWYTSK